MKQEHSWDLADHGYSKARLYGNLRCDHQDLQIKAEPVRGTFTADKTVLPWKQSSLGW